MRPTTAQKIFAGFLAACLILVVGALSYLSARRALTAASWVTHTQEVMVSLERVMAELMNVESGQRGYMLTGDERFLVPYRSGSRNLERELGRLSGLIEDNPAQVARVTALRPIVRDRIAFAAEMVDLCQRGLADSATFLVRTGRGRRLMEDARARIEALQREEQGLLLVRSRQREERARATALVTVPGSAIAFALVAFMIGVIRREVTLHARTAAERDALLVRARQANVQLAAIGQITEAVIAPLALDDLLTELAERVRTVLRADNAGVLLVTRNGDFLELCKCAGISADLLERVKVPVGEGIEGGIVTSAESAIIEDVRAAMVFDPVIREHFASMLGAPLVLDDTAPRSHEHATGGYSVRARPGQRVIGVLYVASVSSRRFTSDERALLDLAGKRVASAVERARLHQAERRSEERFRLLVDSVRDYALFLLDVDGHVSSWNAGAARLYGYEARDAIGSPLARFYAEEDGGAAVAADHVARARAEGNVRSEGWRVRADGSRFWADAIITALRDEDDGNLIGFAKVARDLSERRGIEEALIRAKEEAEAASAAKSQFLATMSHEIRTPINAVMGYTQLLELGLSGPVNDEQREKLARVEASARHLLGLVNELLDLAKIEADQLRVERVRASAKESVDEALALVFPQANARGLALSNRCVGRVDAQYVGDPHRTEQILVNLLSNAVKFTPVGGRVDVTCGLTDDPPRPDRLPRGVECWCFVRVEDTGIGIAPEQLERIFDPFTQASGPKLLEDVGRRLSYAREHGGTGLGLTISRRLARLMGGDVTVESTLGVGTAFSLWLPAPAAGSGDRSTDGCTTDERRSGTRDAAGLGRVGRVLRERARVVLAAHVLALRTGFGVPNVTALSDVDLADHLDTLLTELALALTVVEEAAGQASRQLRDGTAIQRVLGQRHGGQRAALGWTEQDVRREVALLRDEIERELRTALGDDGEIDLEAALALLARRLEHVERAGVDGWRKRMNPTDEER